VCADGAEGRALRVTLTADVWDYTHLFEYWDERVGAVGRSADALRQLGESERTAVLEHITRLVGAKASAADSKYLAQTAYVMADDLYKAVNAITVFDGVTAAYLTASASTFNRVLTERGMTISYVVDNSFPPDELERPLRLFRAWFVAAGFVYVCPQVLAVDLAARTGEPVGGLIAEGRDLALQLVQRCRDGRRHHAYLDVDFDVDAYPFLVEQAATVPGVISVFRNEAPVAGTEVKVALPEGL
jgi:hypothetical protein